MKYMDANGKTLAVGDIVFSGDDHGQYPDGVITEIIEPDVDYDDAVGAPVQYGPYVHVKWPEHDEPERFSGYVPAPSYYRDDEYQFDDLTKREAG